MKRIFSIFFLTALLLSTLLSLSSCNKFEGGKDGFWRTGSFYTKVSDVLLSALYGDESGFPFLNDGNLDMVLESSISDYSILGKNMGMADLNFSLLLSKSFDFSYTIDVDAFGEKMFKHSVQVGSKQYFDYGSILDAPLYYEGEGYNILTFAFDEFNKFVQNGKYVNSEENYKLNGQNVKADTVEICLNSNELAEWANYICNSLYMNANTIYNEWHYSLLDGTYFIEQEKLHLTRKRYFDDGVLCRESFKLHDNYDQYVVLDIAYIKDGKSEFVQINIYGYNGMQFFDIFNITSEKVSKKNSFETNADIMIGDSIHISLSNKGSESSATGKGTVNLVYLGDETEIPFLYSYEKIKGTAENSADSHIIDLQVDTALLSFEGVVGLRCKNTEEVPDIQKPNTYYNIGEMDGGLKFTQTCEPAIEKVISRIRSNLCGVAPEKDDNDGTVEDAYPPFVIDIEFDDGNSFETDGAYGREYADILSSDTYTYKYKYKSAEEGYPDNYVEQFREDGAVIYCYEFADGTEYDELHKENIKYEVRYDIEKIIYTDYGDDYSDYYTQYKYIYFQSGHCTIDGSEYIYERYYDYGKNTYTFIFNEDGSIRLMVIFNEVDKTTLYTEVIEITSEVPEDAFDLPNFEVVSVQDFFE